jgi:hypothetical protein
MALINRQTDDNFNFTTEKKILVVTDNNFWKSFAILQSAFIATVYVLGKYGSLPTKMLLRYWLLDDSIQNAVEDIKNISAENEIRQLKSQLAAAENTQETPEKINWLYAAVGACVFIVVVVTVVNYTQSAHIESVIDLSFNNMTRLLGDEFRELRSTIGDSTNRGYQMTSFQNRALTKGFKVLKLKLDTILKLAGMQDYAGNALPKGDDRDFGDFS